MLKLLDLVVINYIWETTKTTLIIIRFNYEKYWLIGISRVIDDILFKRAE
ncbi:hypothetical protein MHTCC0001_26530 [Flavobacteriaceae bacterium MHTCC 0001]